MAKELKNISIAIIKEVAHSLAKQTMNWDEPIPPFETRSPHILESCVATPFQKFNKHYLYSGLSGKAATLFYLLVKNHPFQNGNKRVAITTLMVFLYLNGKWIVADNTEVYNFAVWVAQSPPEAKNEVITYIQKFINKKLVKASAITKKRNLIAHGK